MANLPTKRDLFEGAYESMTPGADMSRTDHGGYIDPQTQLAWKAFEHMYKTLNKKFIRSQRHAMVSSMYIIGRQGELGRFVFSRSPYVHHTIDAAETESKRMADTHNAAFGIFQYVSMTRPTQPQKPPKKSTPEISYKQLKIRIKKVLEGPYAGLYMSFVENASELASPEIIKMYGFDIVGYGETAVKAEADRQFGIEEMTTDLHK